MELDKNYQLVKRTFLVLVLFCGSSSIRSLDSGYCIIEFKTEFTVVNSNFVQNSSFFFLSSVSEFVETEKSHCPNSWYEGSPIREVCSMGTERQ